MELTAFAAWLDSAFAGFDYAVSSAARTLSYSVAWLLEPASELMHYLGWNGIALIVLSLALMIFPRTRRMGAAMLLALGVGALITNLALKPLVARPRPYTHDGSVYFQLWKFGGCHTESDFSFPSGHTTAAFAAMTALFLSTARGKGWPALVFAVLMGLSRIYLGVHYASDVLAGALCGVAAAVAAVAIVRRLPQKWFKTPDKTP